MNIYLIGYRCVGKTSIGKQLAKRLQWTFVDLDQKIMEEQQMTITEMVSKYGWEYFREKERSVIQSFEVVCHHVVATGGGIILNPANVAVMKKTGVVIWLKALSQTIRNRMLQDHQTANLRPALSDKGILDEIDEMLRIRNPLYESAKDFSIETDNKNIHSICDDILIAMDRKHGG